MNPLYSKLPKYVQVAELVRERILDGAWQPGQKMPRVAELQEELGVSLGTLDKALKTLEEQQLIRRTQGSGIWVAPGALDQIAPRRVGRGITGVVGIGAPVPQRYGAHFYGYHLLEGIKAAADRAGQHLLLLREQPDGAVWDSVDGVLSWTPLPGAVRPFLPPQMPWVSLNYALEGVPSVTLDEHQGAYAATRHLLELGHRRIAYLLAGGGALQGQRLSGYQAALREAGAEMQPRWVRHLRTPFPDDAFAGAARARMAQWLREDWDELGCSALLAHNDQSALGAIEALQSAGYRVPDDVSVVGYDGTEAAELCAPKLTTVEAPLQEIGRRGVEMLLELREGRAVENIVLPVQLKIGQSSGAWGGANHEF